LSHSRSVSRERTYSNEKVDRAEMAQLELKLCKMIKSSGSTGFSATVGHSTEERSLKALENRLNLKIREAVERVNEVSLFFISEFREDNP
jgi:hypothetical protein